jgi:hypothetical protein
MVNEMFRYRLLFVLKLEEYNDLIDHHLSVTTIEF